MSTMKACHLAQFSRSTFYRKSQAKDQAALRLRIREIAYARPCFGYQRNHVMLRREGWPVKRRKSRLGDWLTITTDRMVHLVT